MDKFFKIIEQEKKSLIDELNSLFPSIRIDDIVNISEMIERILEDFLGSLLRKYSYLLLSINCVEDACFLTKGDGELLFSINIGEDINQSGVLCVYVMQRFHSSKNTNNIYVKINGYGKINTVYFSAPKSLSVRLDFINSMIKNIYECGYNWFLVKIEKLCASGQVFLVNNLYEYIKNIIPSADLRRHVWFATVTKGFGFRLIEREVAMGLFLEMDRNSIDYGYSVNRLACEMLSTRLPQDKLLMPFAIKANEVLDVDISDAKYTREGNIYSAVMKAFYGCESFTIHPVSVHDEAGVVALYPTDKRSLLEPIIEAHKKQLKEICEKSIGKIHSAIKLFDKSEFSVSQWGRFLGGFARGYSEL